MRGEINNMRMPGREVKPGIWVGLNVSIAWDTVSVSGPVYIGSSVRVEPGAVIRGPSWIGHGCVIKAGAHLDRSVLFEYVRIAAGMRVQDMIVSRQYCVDRNGHTVYRGDDATLLRWGDARVNGD
jgi:mannose-1-phosphate guanylyltransferase